MPHAGQLIAWTGDLLVAAAVLSSAYLAACWAVVVGFDRRRSSADAPSLSATILVPLCGVEPGLAGRLRALQAQDYAAPLQIVCGTLDPHDPAIDVAKRVAAECPAGAVEVHVDSRVSGRNLKVANLANMLPHARGDLILMVDSDIEVTADYLSVVTAALQKPGVGAVTCLYRGVSDGGFFANLSALEIDCHFLPNVIMGMSLNLARPCFGATVALARSMLDRVGQFRALLNQLWDDYAIGEAVRRSGAEVAIVPLVVAHVCSERSLRDLIDRQLRMARTIRGIDPWGYAGGLITHPFPLALLAVLFGGGRPALLLAALSLAGRIGIGRSIERRFGGRRNAYWALPMRELISFAIHIAGLFGSVVTWRGRRYRVFRDGMVAPLPDEADDAREVFVVPRGRDGARH